MLYQTKFLISLFVTLIIEIPVLFLMLRFFYKNKKISVERIVFVGFFASALTLPYLWFVLPPYVLSNHYLYFGEFLVFIFEALVYSQLLEFNFKKSSVLSFVCNFFSFAFGLFLF